MELGVKGKKEKGEKELEISQYSFPSLACEGNWSPSCAWALYEDIKEISLAGLNMM